MSDGTLGNQIVTPEEYALLGVKASQAGLSAQQLSALLAVIERETYVAAVAAAKQVALSVLPDLLTSMQNVHVNAATSIRDRLAQQTAGFGGMLTHRKCVDIANAVLGTQPQPRVIEQGR